MTLTLTDLFCGAGGSSTGAIQVPGVTVRVASNHWKLAVDTHNTNHPDAAHICADLSQINPRYFPATDVAWMSPECTNHSLAKGAKQTSAQADMFGDTLPDDAAERSRATMLDVPRFAEHHRYRAVIVENVVEVTKWVLYPAWLSMMDVLGYRHRVMSLNSMHAQLGGLPAAQSRDRVYIVFWRKGDRAPDLERVVRPKAWCPSCDAVVDAMQAFKPGRSVGRYRAQYVYRCPNVACRNSVVEPGWLPAAHIIDWSLPGQRIGDRKRPLAEKTRARIKAGIERYWSPLHLEAAGNTYDAADPRHPAHGNPDGYYRAWPVGDPFKTIHTSMSKALAIPVEGRDGKVATPLTGPLRTQTTRLETGLAVPCGGTWNDTAAPLSAPLRTRTARETDGVAMPPFVAELRGGGSTARLASDPLATVCASGNHHGLVTTYYGNGGAVPTSDALPTVTTVERHALLMRNNTARGDQGQMSTPVSEPVRTITAAGNQSLLTGRTIDVDDVLFRMLEPGEVKRAMDFPDDYILLGNRREQVKMSGNAVTPCAARDIVTVVAEALGVAA